jgi:uncharacterized protein YdbL (DUF1318 family)
MTKRDYIVLIILSFILLFTANSYAQGIKAIKTRMKERLPVIVDLKERGLIGENNLGFLEFHGGEKEKVGVVKAENDDRMKVYKAIAKREGSTPENVGRRRAIKIAEKADIGEWLEDESGMWYQKK